MATMLDAVINLKDNFSETLKHIDNKAKNFSKTYAKMGGDIQKTGKDIAKVGGGLTKSLTLPIVGVGIASAKLATDLDESMGTISTLIPAASKRIKELKGDIQDVAITTAKGTKEIAEGTYGVISAYGDAVDTMEKVELNAKAATAGLATTNDALDLSSAIMKGFGDTTADANEHVLDLAFTTLKLGQTSFEALASSMGKVVPTTNELGISQEELFAVFATGTGVTGNASEVATQYQGILKSLMSPTKDMTGLLSQMGYEDGKAMLAKEGLSGAIGAVVEASKKTGQPLQKYIGSIEGQVLALALAGEQSGEYSRKLEELKNSSGALDTAFKEQTDGIGKNAFTFKQAMIKMEVAGQKMGDTLAPIIGKVADLISKLGDTLGGLTPKQMDMIAKFAMFAAVIGPLVLVIGELTSKIGGTIKFFGDWGQKITKAGGLLKYLTSPAMLVVGALVAIIAVGVLLYKNWDTIKEKAGQLKEKFMELGGGGLLDLIEIFKKVGEIAMESVEKIIDSIRPLGETIGETIMQIADLLEPVMPYLLALLGFIGGNFVMGVIAVFLSMVHAITGIITTIIGVIDGLLTFLSGFIDFIIGGFSGDWDMAWKGIEKMTDGVIKALISLWNGLIDILSAPVEAMVDILDGVFKDKVKGIKDMWNSVKTFLKNPIQGTVSLFKNGNLSGIGENYKGTNNWRGGLTSIHERGGEIIDLPSGSRVYPHDKSVSMARKQGKRESGGNSSSFRLDKIADTIIIREEADIDKIAKAIARKLKQTSINTP